jgi:uncharacterized Zn finger protein (UPF0148 family)
VVAVIQRPDGMGPMPAEYPCGYRFQVHVAGPAELCRCGRQSIGRCAGCGRPLCGNDGTLSGLFLCPECISQRDQRRHAEEQAAAEQQQAAAARQLAEARSRRTAAITELAEARGVDELIRIIVANAADIPDEVGKAAWLRIVSSKAIAPTHEIVTAIGLRHMLYDWSDPGRDWREVSRAEAWSARGLMVGDGSTTSDQWLAGDGSMWTAAGSQDLRLYENGTPQTYPFGRNARGEPNWIAIPSGEVFRTRFRSAPDHHNRSDRNSPWSYVPGGVRLSLQPANGHYARVAAAILCTR